MVGELRNPVPYSVRELPVIGNLTARVGRVVAILGTPCNPTPQIMVLAAFNNLPKLFFSIFKPDPLDLVSARFGTPHHKNRKMRFQVMDQMTGKKVGGNKYFTWALFAGKQLAERIGWYFIIADATTEFAVNWTSTVYEWSGCQVPGTPFAEFFANDAYVRYPAGEHFAIAGPHSAFPPFNAGHGYVANPANYTSGCSATFQWKSEASGLMGAGHITGVRLVDAVSGETSPLLDMIDGPNGAKVAHYNYQNWGLTTPARQFNFIFNIPEEAWFNFAGTWLQLYGHKDKGILADP